MFGVFKNLININKTWNKHKSNWECVAVVHWRFHRVVAPKFFIKEQFVFLSVYWQILLFKSSFKRLIFTSLDQLNTKIQGISFSPYSCLQWHLRPVTSTHIFQQRGMKYHKIRDYSRGTWWTVSLFFTTSTANLSTAVSGSCSSWSSSSITGFQTSLYMWYPRTAEFKVIDFTKQLFVCCCCFFFNAKEFSTLWRVLKW